MKDVFWIETAGKFPSPRLAIILRPRGEDWLEDELKRLKREGVETVVSMLEEQEAEWLGLANEGHIATELGLTFLSHPIPDRNVPSDVPRFRSFVQSLADRVVAGGSVGVHCRGSIGRSTLATAAVMVHLGWSPLSALSAIQDARGCPVPDTDEQQSWILSYRAKL